MVDLKIVKPEHLWYVVGLIATDGNLSKDGRHIILTSKDLSLLEDLKKALFIDVKIGRKASGSNQEKKYGILQFSDVAFYKFLLSIGLEAKKSLILGPIDVPKAYFGDFLRGIIDGDGSIREWRHSTNNHVQWSLSVVSAAPVFINWLAKEIERTYSIKGKMHVREGDEKRNAIYLLKFGKLAAKIILADIYYKGCLALDRKLKSSLKCLESNDGWSKFKTLPKVIA